MIIQLLFTLVKQGCGSQEYGSHNKAVVKQDHIDPKHRHVKERLAFFCQIQFPDRVLLCFKMRFDDQRAPHTINRMAAPPGTALEVRAVS